MVRYFKCIICYLHAKRCDVPRREHRRMACLGMISQYEVILEQGLISSSMKFFSAAEEPHTDNVTNPELPKFINFKKKYICHKKYEAFYSIIALHKTFTCTQCDNTNFGVYLDLLNTKIIPNIYPMVTPQTLTQLTFRKRMQEPKRVRNLCPIKTFNGVMTTTAYREPPSIMVDHVYL